MKQIPHMCYECNKPSTELTPHQDFHGYTFAVACNVCSKKIRKMLDKLFSMHGGIKGKCPCYGSPSIIDVKHLEELTK